MSFARVNGIDLWFQVAGDPAKPPLLLSNSLGTALAMWDGQMDDLTRHFFVVRYDARGHGRSDAPAGPYRIETLGRDALALLDTLAIETASFMGLSMGGMIGMWLATHAPDRIERLALCNTAAFMPPATLWDERIAAVTENGMAPMEEPVLERWFTDTFRRDHPEAVAPVRAMIGQTPPQGYAGCCAAIRDMDQRESIAAIAAPTLVIGGEHDPSTPPERAMEIATMIPGAQLVVLNAAHLSNIEARDAFNQAVVEFLAAETRHPVA